MLSAPVARIAGLRRRLRMRVWVARTRLRMRAQGCDVRVTAGPGAGFAAPPVVEITRQGTGSERPGRRGSLTIVIGAGAELGRLLTIEVVPSADNALTLGDGVTFGNGVRVMLFGGSAEIGAWSRVRDGSSLKSSGALSIGEHGIVQSHGFIHCAERVAIADHVTLAERVTVIDSDHGPDGTDAYSQTSPLETAPVEIGRNVWVGANAVLLRGTRLGRNAVVGAGAVVRSGEYPEGWLVAGSPAEAKRPLGNAK